jgi:hypothetical protein
MNHETVRIILEKVISSPANVNLAGFDEAIRWVEGRGTNEQLDMGTDWSVSGRNSAQRQLKCAYCVGFWRAVGSPEPRSQPNVC